VFKPDVMQAFIEVSRSSLQADFEHTFMRAIFAGWLIATMVWMMPAADSSRPVIIIVMTYIVSLGQLPHVIAGASEVFYQVIADGLPWRSFFTVFLVPTLIGNTLGGVLLVALFNHAQVVTEAK
jgi:formate/nitrite transporter FocA (FNT family)